MVQKYQEIVQHSGDGGVKPSPPFPVCNDGKQGFQIGFNRFFFIKVSEICVDGIFK